jgi:hypothetical protein
MPDNSMSGSGWSAVTAEPEGRVRLFASALVVVAVAELIGNVTVSFGSSNVALIAQVGLHTAN